ncbi:MAG: restriction endonuclease subunit S [Bacteroidetes bacterium]|nr:restriction endonuclease subunit S [Bacteroidota bacterium]
MRRTIIEIASIQTGVYAQTSSNGHFYYIQARHFDHNRQFITAVKPELSFDEKLEKHILHKGDVLVAAKGYDRFAVAYSNIPHPAVASSMFIVLRIIDKNQILPEYLAWFINHPKTQNILSLSSKGTALPSVTKDDVGKLEILIPSIEQQKSVLKLYELFQKERQLKLQLDALSTSKIQQQIFTAISEKDEQ